MIERPKYIEYRHQRDRIASFTVKRSVEVKVEQPAAALLRLVGKKTSARKDSYQEEWVIELRTTDVMPDRGALVKTQVTSSSRFAKGEPLAYGDREDPKTEFLNEVVDVTGMLSGHAGSLPTPHLVLLPEEPLKSGQEWQRTRHELVPISGSDGQVKSYEPRAVAYQCRVDGFGEEAGVDYADIDISGVGEFETAGSLLQMYTVLGRARFALRDGHILSADITRSMATTLDKTVLTRSVSEQFAFMSRGTEQTVGGMRM